MTARNPLFEFMPYGAPELLAAQRPQLLRALVLASALALAAFMLAQALGLTFTGQRPVVIELPRPPVIIDTPPAIRVREPQPAKIAVPAKAQPIAEVQPVPDELAPRQPAVVSPGEGRPDGVDPGTHQPVRDLPSGPVTIAEDPLPAINEIVVVDELPEAVKIVEPTYPDLPRDIGIEGRVYVHMLVGKDGRVVGAEIDPKFSVPMLDESALLAARQWVFKPGFVNQHPVAVWVGQMFVYTLHK